jgi:glycosyltransferase involved in cell wall biosynthesis
VRILYGTDHVFPSTAADTEQVINTVAALGRRGVEVELIAPRPRGAEPVTADGLRRHYHVTGPFRVSQQGAPFPSVPFLHKSIHAVAVCRARRPDEADLLYTRNLWMLGAAIRRGFRVAFDHFRPWGDQYPALKPLLQRWMRHSRFLGATLHSRMAADSYRRLGIPSERILVAHNGFEPSRMQPRLDREAARAAIGLEGDGPIAMYAGRLNARKGLDVLLAMADALPGVRFVLVGSEGRGVIEQEAERRANVEVFPWQPADALAPFLYAADALVVPPSTAPLHRHGSTVLPIKLYLYLAAGRAIFAPRAPDTEELLVHDENACLVTAGDPSGAADALGALLEDADRRARLGAAARILSDTLTWDARAEKLQTFLEDRLAVTPLARSKGRVMP